MVTPFNVSYQSNSLLKWQFYPNLGFFFFLFQALPVFFEHLDSVISSYIWKGRRVYLQKTKATGNLAIPNFSFYYWAVNLCCLTLWSCFRDQTDHLGWVTTEPHTEDNTSLAALLGSSLPFPSLRSLKDPVVKHSLRIWLTRVTPLLITGCLDS